MARHQTCPPIQNVQTTLTDMVAGRRYLKAETLSILKTDLNNPASRTKADRPLADSRSSPHDLAQDNLLAG